MFAGYYTRYNGKQIYVVRIMRDIDTGAEIIICKDASFQKQGNEEYYIITKASFCQQLEVDAHCATSMFARPVVNLTPEL